MKSTLRILLLEDDPNDAELIQALLEADHFICDVTRVEARAEFLSALETIETDLILADHKLPSFDGISALKLAQSARPDLPFIFVSGSLGEEVAIESLKIGATDYVLKTGLARLVPSVQRALREVRETSERKRAEDTLREQANLLNLTQDAIYVRDMNGTITYWNRGAEELYGWSAGQAIGKIAHELLMTIFPVPFVDIEQALNRTGRWRGELVHTTRDGMTVDVSSRWSLQRDDKGAPVAVLISNTDITERKRAEQAREDMEEQWRAAFESNPTMYFIVDSTGMILLVNAFGAEQLGYTPAELLGRPVLDVFHEPDRNAVQKYAQECFAQPGRTMRWEARKIRKDGSMLWVRETANAVFLKKRPVLLVVCENMTEQKRAEEAARRSEKELRDVIEALPTMAIVTSSDGATVWVNQRWVEYSGLSAEETSEPGWREAIHPDDRDTHVAKWRQSIAGGQPFENEARHRSAQGDYRWFLVRFVPLRDVHGDILKWYGTLTDLEDRKRAEQALFRSEAYLAESQRLTHTGSWAFRADSTRAIYWSEENFRIWGLDPRHGLPDRESLLQRVHPEDRDRVTEAAQSALREGRELTIQFRIVRPDGTVRHLQGLGHPVFSASGELVEVVGTHVDVTERKRAEEERERLRHLEADLAHINRVSMMGELAASLTHEIKQPIAGAATRAAACGRWLSQDPPNLTAARDAASAAVGDLTRAADIIDRVRSLYRRGSLEPELVDVNDAIEEMTVLLGETANRSSISVRTDLDPELPTTTADRVQLQQVLMNLMLNGIEAMTGIGGELTVTSQSTEDGQLLISVRDSGVGLPVDDSERVFEAFFTTKPQGSGMGLAISRRIVESHGGRLWAKPNSGPGATFQFTLRSGTTGSSRPAT